MRTITLWEKFESCLYEKKDLNVLNDFKINAYTGDPKSTYLDMKVKRSIRLGI